MEDITKTGPVGLNGLSGVSTQGNDEYFTNLMKLSGRQTREMFTPEASEDIGVELGEAGYGRSSYDSSVQNLSQLENIKDIRGQNQAWYEQLGAGIGKGISLAATTFLDGTLGFAYGLGSAVAHGDYSKIWDNEVSNGLQWWNNQMEQWLPNYRTEEEQNNSWLENLGTMNFWADSFLKNMGFTVGALYSGNAWTKGLKALGAVNGAMGAKIAGSMLSAVNEGRIEANNNSDDWEKLEMEKLQDAYRTKYDEIMGTPDTLVNAGTTDSPKYVSKKYSELEALKQNYDNEVKSIQDRKAKMGLMDLIGNTVLLSLDNFYTYGKLYARGFKNARDKAASRVGREEIEQASKEIAQEEAGKRIKKEAGKYTFDTISKGEAARRGLGRGLVEGQEEMTQQWIANTSGNYYSYDSPDAYYNALTDSKAERQTKDFITSATQGFMDSYGNFDQWEQFAVGALTGLLGTPTFGKLQNSDANTWLGRGRSVGISGGLFGEMGEADRQNREGQEAVDYMNTYMSKLQDRERYFVQSQSFTNAMDGWAEEGNAFEYKNAEDNDDFAAISRFAKVGKLGDLKDMVNQDFEGIDDVELEKIAQFTTEEDSRGGWRNPDGSLMTDTDEGKQAMREELSKKRDKILSEIDRYEKSIETIRALGNNSLDEDQVNELAWLDWKIGRFDERFKNIKEENQDIFTTLSNSLMDYKNSIDETTEEGKKWSKGVNNLLDFVSYLQGAKSSLDLAARVNANPRLMEVLNDKDTYDLYADNSGLSYSSYTSAIDNLRDAGRIASATKKFNDRYKEFSQDPIKLVQNREEISEKKAKVNKVKEDISTKEKVEEANVSDLVKAHEAGEASLDDLSTLFAGDDDLDFIKSGLDKEHQKKTGASKVAEATKIVNTSANLTKAGGVLDTLAKEKGVDAQVVSDAKKMVEASKNVAESEEELLDIRREIYNDPNTIFDLSDPTISQLQANPSEMEEAINARAEAARNFIEEARLTYAEERDKIADIPKSIAEGETVRKVGEELVGHDATEKGVPVNKSKEEKVSLEEATLDKIKETINPSLGSIEDIKAIIRSIKDFKEAGAEDVELIKEVAKTKAYERAVSKYPSLPSYFREYLTELRTPSVDTKTAPKIVREDDVTPTVTVEEVNNQQDSQAKQDVNKEDLPKGYKYWKPTTTRLPIHADKGDFTPFYQVVALNGGVYRYMTSNGEKILTYTPEQMKRMEAVYKYLDSHSAFGIVDAGEVKAGDSIGFFIDKSLNEEAGEIVILMVDSHGRVVGDVMSENDNTFSWQTGLPQLVERIKKEYEDAGSPDTFTSVEKTTVDKNMVGKVPYIVGQMNTLNDIYEGESFMLGVALTEGGNARIMATAGRRKSQGQSALERTIIPPVNAKVGQPYLLMPTSNAKRKYMPVPFIMPPFSSDTLDTALGKAVMKVLGNLQYIRPSDVMGVKRELLELLAIPELHINLLDNGNLKIDIKPADSKSQITIYNSSPEAFGIHNEVASKLFGMPFQVSRKYINDTYNGQDYNKMIGELAMTNLGKYSTHTVNEWFTLNPIAEDGSQIKAKSPKSTGQNPNQAAPSYTMVSYSSGDKTILLSVDTKTYDVIDPATGKIYSGKKADAVKAEAWGYMNNAPTDKPYSTKWGWFDPVKKEFVDAPMEPIKKIGAELVAEGADLTEQAKKKGLLGNNIRKALWNALTPSQQATIVNKKGPKQEQWMTALERAYNPNSNNFDESKLKGTVDDMLTRKGLYRKESSKEELWNKEKELSWLKKALPNLSSDSQVRILDGLIKVSDDEFAWGQFKQGVIYLASNAARGTVYHEAFHAVTHTLLSSAEQKELFKEAAIKYGNLDSISLEEQLAEDFRRYVQIEETPFIGKVLKLFRTLKHIVQQLLGRESYLDSMFYRINRGKLKDRVTKTSNVTRNRDAYTIQSAIKKLQSDYAKSAVHVNSMHSTDRYNIQSFINSKGLSEVLYPYLQNSNGKYSIARISESEYKKKYNKLQDELRTSWESELSADDKLSNQALQDQESYYRIVEQHHRDKLAYNRLSQEDKEYLKERGIDIETYSQMSQFEKEVLFECKY